MSRLNKEGGSGPDQRVLESYTPLRLEGSQRAAGVFELYQDYRPVARSVHEVVRAIAIVLVLALLVLYVSLFPILRRVTRALEQRNRHLAERTRELSQALLQLGESELELATSREETIRRLSSAAEYRDDETGRHIERMSSYSAVLARRLGLDEKTCELIRIASPLHDVGKIAIPDALLHKPGPLTAQERKQMEEHARIGHEMLAGSHSDLLQLAATIAFTHHERVDGSGYPRRLRGDQIPLVGRIAAVADVFDALTSDRVYRPAMSIDAALEIMQQGRGSHFDEHVFDAFENALDELIAIGAQLGGTISLGVGESNAA